MNTTANRERSADATWPGSPCCLRCGILCRESDATRLRCSALHPHPHTVPGHGVSLLGVKASQKKPSPLHSWRKQGPEGPPLRQALPRAETAAGESGVGGALPPPPPGPVLGAARRREGISTCCPCPGAARGHLLPQLLEAGRYPAPRITSWPCTRGKAQERLWDQPGLPLPSSRASGVERGRQQPGKAALKLGPQPLPPSPGPGGRGLLPLLDSQKPWGPWGKTGPSWAPTTPPSQDLPGGAAACGSGLHSGTPCPDKCQPAGAPSLPACPKLHGERGAGAASTLGLAGGVREKPGLSSEAVAWAGRAGRTQNGHSGPPSVA